MHRQNRQKGRKTAKAASNPAAPKSERQPGLLSEKFFPIAGIGASAGGLEAFTQLLKCLPVDTGMAFVLVQHLDPQHDSALTTLLTRTTSMPVCEVTNNLRVKANHVYVIPPNTSMAIANGVLKLSARRGDRGAHRSIDFFFEALAQDHRERSIGVILSGTATDGTLGLEAIKAEGGITFAQDASAKYDSMPRSAIAAGCVDFVLSPEEIAKELARIAKHPYVANASDHSGQIPPAELEREDGQFSAPEAALASGGHGTPATGAKRARAEAKGEGGLQTGGDGFKKVLLLLRNHCGVDFSLYKSSTIQRRVTRRMVLNKQEKLEEYSTFLKGNAKELDALYSDVLISVTSFFRNPEAFDVLKQKVFPKLFQQRGRDDALRVWIVGCSTGQEAYSIAMSFAEFTENISRVPKLQVFATDMNEPLLEKARNGLYAKSLAQDVSPERLRRFFVEEEGGYRVIKMLREQIVFARQNLISDPPFSRMDLISCRNLLIYLDAALQKKIIPAFHYALKPGGFLFLGASESVGGFNQLFEPADKKQKIFAKKPVQTPHLDMPISKERVARPPPGQRPVNPVMRVHSLPEEWHGELNAQREADRFSVNRFAPPGVLINADLQILQFRGSTSAYLEPPTGKANFDLLKMAREGLMLPLRAAINKAKKENTPVRRENVRFSQNGTTRTVNVEVVPLKNLKERCFLVLFQPAEAKKPGQIVPSAPPAKPLGKREESHRLATLERELSETRDYLQSVQEQYEAANEELQAQSEELQSGNEELQSINEELETSKEELESTNEELTTVNEEMANRNTELSRSNADLNNLHVSINTAILVLARDLTIRRFTAQAEKLFNLLATDVGRPINGIRHNLDFSGLEETVREVIDTVNMREREVQDKEGRWYALRIRPYMTLDNKIDGAVLMLTDVHALKRSEQQAKEAREYADATIRTARESLVILRADLRVNTANDAFYKTFKTTPNQTEGRLIYELGNGQWNNPKLRELLEDVLPRHSFFNDFEVAHEFPSIGKRTMLASARPLQRESEAPPMIVFSIEDLTERLESQAAVRRSELRYRRLFEAAHDGVLLLDPVTRKITDANPFMAQLLGYGRKELLGKELWEVGLIQGEQASHALFRELQRDNVIRREDLPLETKGGEKRITELVANLYQEDGHKVIQCNIRDVTERKHAEEMLRKTAAWQRLVTENIKDFAIFSLDKNGYVVEWNPGAKQVFGYTTQEILGQHGSILFTPEDRSAGVPEAEMKTAEREDCAVDDRWHLRKGGQRFFANGAMRPIRDESGAMHGFVKVARDVTEKKQTEEALRQSEQETKRERDYAEATLRTAPVPLLVLEDDLRVITANDAFYKTFKVEPLQTERRFVYELGEGQWDIPKLRDLLEDILPHQTSFERFEVTHDFPSIGKRTMLLNGRRMVNKEGERQRIVLVIEDITERKRAEEQVADQSAHLEQLVNERTAKLRETIGELETFSYSLSHDMRAPLRAMQSFGRIVLAEHSSQLDAEGKRHLERINAAADRMDLLIQDVLTYTRVLRGQIKMEPIDLNRLVREIIETYPQLTENDPGVRIEGELPTVLGNQSSLTQSVSNLLTNAVKFVAHGTKPQVKVWAQHIDSDVRLWIEDNGIGIKPQDTERIFRMFERVHRDTEYEGTGIGLAIVRKAVEKMGGSVGVESQVGQGSKFWIQLRRAEAS